MSEEKECFSRRYGYSGLKLQVDGMDDTLKMDIVTAFRIAVKECSISKKAL